ncbi:MAG: DASS family sodium-coupled anion symporter [Candidatus Omnitrophica bacterium]|nr:DASS family sodium-coupled anion symporter [Candidatus Omnitrophota bacterium]
MLYKSLKSSVFLKASIVMILALCAYFMAPASMSEPSRRVFFIFVFSALFWALEIIPLYATSLLVILLETFFLCRPGGVMNMDSGGYKVFLLPFGSPIIILFLGGFILACAMQKYHIDRIIARRLLKLFGNKPYMIMLGFMMSTAFLSMWMSNTATTAMMIAMLLPLLKQIDPADPYRTGLILSIPFAANIGGIGTPVGTPPNAIAIGILANKGIYLSFISWMKMAFPLAVILIFVTSVVLFVMYRPKTETIQLNIEFQKSFDRETKMAMTIALLTVLLWLTSEIHKIPAAIIALTAAGLFAALGLLDRDDFKTIDWDVLVLMWGGLALGKGMEISGLTQWIVDLPLFEHTGFVLVAVFCLFGLLLSTFMSNTATANLLIPIIMVIPGENNILLAATVALSCSFAMALPVSTPPNAIAFATNMIHSKDMLKAGALVSILSLLAVLLGFRFIVTAAFGIK